MSDSQEAFEKWITASPYELSVRRFPQDAAKYAWPGSYEDIRVQLAWDAWQKAVETVSKETQ